jgi:MFS family permease
MPPLPPWYLTFAAINVALAIFSQLLPLYAYFLGAKAAQVGLLSAVGSATSIVASLFWGKLADISPRRRPFVLLGFFGLAAGYALLPLLTEVNALLPLNAGVTFLWTAAGTVSTLLVLASFSRSLWERELGRFNAISGIGWSAGLVAGAVWTTILVRFVGEGWGLRSLGLAAAFTALVAALLSLKFVPEPAGSVRGSFVQDLSSAMGNFVAELRRYGPLQFFGGLNPVQLFRFFQGRTTFGPELVLCYYGEFLSFVAFSLVFAPFPVFLRQTLGWPNELVFSLYVAHHAISVFAYRLARQIIERVGHRPALALSLLVRVGIFAGFAAVQAGASAALLPFFFALAGLSWSFFQLSTMALVSRLSLAAMRGQALGVYNATAGLGNMVGAILGGYLADAFGFAAPFLSAAALLLLTLPILLVEGRPAK